MKQDDDFALGHKAAGEIIRLLAAVGAARVGMQEKKRLLMTGLATLVCADAWSWSVSPGLRYGEAPKIVGTLSGGFSEEQLAHYIDARSDPETGDFSAAFVHELSTQKIHLTRAQPQLDPERRFYKLAVRKKFNAAGIDTIMHSFRPMEKGGVSAVALYRMSGRPHFSFRETHLAHIVLTGIPKLHEYGWPDDRHQSVWRLSPRELSTLNFLCAGWSRDQIAKSLKISRHTVDGYVKTTFKKIAVNSQAQLICRFDHGDGGDISSPTAKPTASPGEISAKKKSEAGK